EDSLQITSAPSTTDSFGAFISPYALNLGNYTKLVKRLQERRPEVSRDDVVEAVREVRRNNEGVLNNLSISSIEERVSVIL
ncbi:RNA-binding protein 44, partial [Acanthisitta chloris]